MDIIGALPKPPLQPSPARQLEQMSIHRNVSRDVRYSLGATLVAPTGHDEQVFGAK
jgi:hypothetical protein